jgi:membrane-bound lytic murein transglycosylase A
MTYEEMSMQSIRRYLEGHPDVHEEVLGYNPSYVFFREVDEGPIGAMGRPLTALRSIATDKSLFPVGALCYLETELPVFGDQDEVTGWEPFSGFVLNQDTGGAIKGPHRVDLFTGFGEQSEMLAGHLKQNGRIYYLILSPETDRPAS